MNKNREPTVEIDRAGHPSHSDSSATPEVNVVCENQLFQNEKQEVAITSRPETADPVRSTRIDWGRALGLFGMHCGCLGIIWVGWSWTAVGIAIFLYLIRTFALTAFYHRYFSHRAFKTSRIFQFMGGCLGCFALQKGPLWWASHHRHHHRESDQNDDVHSPVKGGFFWSHIGWLFRRDNSRLRWDLIRDWRQFPELRFLERFSILLGVAFGGLLFLCGMLLERVAPGLNTNGPMLLVWGFFVSTVFLYHVTYSVNSISHMFGSRRFQTSDDSRNNSLVAIFTLGEGWHNNHHHYQSSARQGFYWWEIDVTYYVLVILSKLRIVWDLRPVPAHVYNRTIDPATASQNDS